MRRPDLSTPATRSARGCNPHVLSLYLHVTAGGGEREESEAVAPVAETMQSEGRREAEIAEMRLKAAGEPLATLRPLTATDAAQAEAALRACRESGVPTAVTAKVSE